jgi:hypothetical protein
MAKARNPRGMPSPELLETCNTSIARLGTYLFRYSLEKLMGLVKEIKSASL